MRRDEIMMLLGIGPSELNELIVRDDINKTRTVIRKAMTKAHPDNAQHGNAQLFMRLKDLYDLVKMSGIRNIIDDISGNELVFDIDEMRSMSPVIVDVLGTSYNRKEAVNYGCKIRLKMRLILDGIVFPVEYKAEYRQDSKYVLELRPYISKAQFIATKGHTIKLEICNTYDKAFAQMSWTGVVTQLKLRVKTDRLIVEANTAIKLCDVALDE